MKFGPGLLTCTICKKPLEVTRQVEYVLHTRCTGCGTVSEPQPVEREHRRTPTKQEQRQARFGRRQPEVVVLKRGTGR